MKTVTLGVDVQVNSKSFKELQKGLTDVIADLQTISQKDPLSKTLAQNVDQAKKLERVLNGAWDSKLNQLDMSKFNTGLKSAGVSAQNVKNILSSYPTTYEQFSRTIIEGNTHLRQTNKLLDKMAVTMANTVRFGISSSIFNNLTNSIQKAYDYTLKLDKSLNDIRIVSDASAESMVRFAKYANESAKRLGSSTLEYTKGALIYYQQGLSEDEVIKRTDTTIKMSNVLGRSTEEVSNYMTAIWNNFADGTTELEYYGDVITALGAKTASSAEEIAGGLEKFAAVGKTIGLSYEYATSALTTITATTRQSEDTVGNALKTIFARIQGLKLGETLEDGTTLNKYSEALEKVGVSIKDESGELKAMDTILNELGQTWGTLTNAQKAALAQTVAGVRQYNQLIALMDNWGFFQENLNTAYNSTGTLAQQQDIYLDSLEAHLNKLQTEWEKTYDIIFDENTIKEFANIATAALSGLNTWLTSLGGGMNTIVTLGAQLANVFSNQIGAEFFRQMSNSAQETGIALENILSKEKFDSSSNAYQQELKIAEQIKTVRKALNEDEYKAAVERMRAVGAYQDKIDEITGQEREMRKDMKDFSFKDSLALNDKGLADFDQWDAVLADIDAEMQKINQDTEEGKKQFEELKKAQQVALTNRNRAQNIADKENYVDLLKQEKSPIDLLQQQKLEQMQIQDFVRGTTAAASLLGVTLGTIKGLTNENLTGWEKAKVAMAGLANAALIVVKNWDSLKGLTSALHSFISGVAQGLGKTAAQAQATHILKEKTEQTTKAEIDSAIAKEANAKASGKVAAAELEEAAAKKALNNGGEKLVETGEKVVQTEEALGKGANVASDGVSKLGMSFGASLKALLPYLAAIVAIVAVVAGTYYILHKAEIDEAKEQKKLQEELDKTKEKYQAISEEYQEVSQTLSNYQSGLDGLENLEKGTIKWYEAIVKTNEEAQKLIDKWGLVANQDYTLGADGLISINEDVIEKKMYDQLRKQYQAQADVQRAQYAIDKKRIDKEQEKIVKNFKKDVNKTASRENSSSRITTSQAETMLINMNQPQTNIGTTNLVSEMFNTGTNTLAEAVKSGANSIVSGADQNTIDITDSFAKWGSEYQVNLQKLEAQQTQWATTQFFASATKEQSNYYASMSDIGQKAVIEKLKPRFEVNVAASEEYAKNSREDISAQLWEEVGNDMNPLDVIGNASDLGAALAYDFNLFGARDKYSEPIVRNKQSQNIQEWSSEDVAQVLDQVKRQDARIYNAGFSGSSQRYLSDVLTATSASTLTKEDLEILTPKELEYYQNTLNEQINRQGLLTKSGGFLSTAGDFIQDHSQSERWDGVGQFISNLGGKTQSAGEWLDSHKNMFEENVVSQWIPEIQNDESLERDSLGRTEKRQAADLEDYNNILKQQAEALDTSKEALDFYAVAMENAGDLTNNHNEESAEAIAQQYKFNKTYNKAVSIYEDNEDAIKAYSKALKNNKNISSEVADAMGEVSLALKDMGLSLSAETISDHLDLIQQLLTGTEDEARAAYEELLKLAQIDVLKSLFGDSEQMISQYESIINHINSLEPGENMDGKYADKLRNMINDSNISFSQIQELANQLHIDIPVEYDVPEDFSVKDVKFTTAAKSTTHQYSGQMPNPAYDGTNEKTIPVDYAWVETVEAKEDSFKVPEGTDFKVKNTNANVAKGANLTKSPLGRGSGKKGGKGGGSGSKKEPKKIEKTKDESDRYHKVNTQIEKTSNQLDMLDKAEEKALGGDWVKNLTQQFQLLNNQIANYNEKLRIANGEQNELKKKLAGQGVAFNADGTISNYNAAFDAQLAKLNALEDQYNHLSAAQQEKWDENKTIDKAKEDFNKFKENMDRYDELVSSFIPDLQKQIQDAIDEIVEKQVEKFNKGIELRLDMAEAERDWNEFKTKVIDGIDEDDIIGQTQAKIRDFATYYDKNTTGSIQALTNHLKDIMNEMNKKVSNVYGQDDAKELEDLRKYYEELMEEMEGVFDLQKEIHENYLDMLDEAQDKFDEQVEAYEMVSDLIEHDMNLIELVYGEGAYTELGKFYEKQAENNKEQLEFQKQQVAFWREVMDSEEEGSKEWENAKEKWTSATSDLNDLIETSIENLQDKYLNAIEGIFDKLNDEVTKGKGLDFIDTEWQLINKEADQYLDTINQLFETQALENKYLDAIDQTDNIAAQRKLKDLMDEELTALREKDKLTQYDIERANKRYEIALKQIALEEAQQNKSTMRLRRDSQGNYRYEYVADNDAIDQARDELEKLKNDLYNFDKAQYEESLGEMYDTWVEYQDALKEAAQINDPEERAEKEALIKEKYGDIINNMLAENAVIRQNLEQSAFEDLALLYDKNLEDYTNMTDAEKDTLMNDLVPAWGSGIQEMIDTMVGEGGFYPTCDEAFLELEHEQDNLSQGFEEIQDAGDVAFEAIANGTDTAIEKAKELIGVNEEVIDTYEEKVETMKNLTTQIDELANSFRNAGNEATGVIQKVHDLLKKTDEKNAAEYDKAAKAATTDKTVTNAINGNPTTTTSAPAATTTSAPAAPTASSYKGISNISGHDALVDVVWGVWQGRYGNGAARRAALQSAYGVEGQKIIQGLVNNTQGYTKSKTKLGNRLSALGYDTGGYTGSWNNNGRLAFLHQKELVLNATDTENMLNAINVMRNLTNSVGIATLARLASLGASGSAGIGGNGLEQNVHISATFPNATSTREIEEALLNLTNRASQMIGRR